MKDCRMHSHSLDDWTHEHDFLGQHHVRNERRTAIVVVLTVVMMIAEIGGGMIFGSLALLADGWHMSTHAAALAIAALAYRYARQRKSDRSFSFGTGKVGELAAFGSAIVLGIVAIMVAYESVVRLAAPQPIRYGEAIAIAIVGLLVNLVSAWLLRDDHHSHSHQNGHEHHHHHRDNNLRAAYVHVLADAATSILAIAGLLIAKTFDLVWIDPFVAIIGSLVIANWAWGLMRDSSSVLIDAVPDPALEGGIRTRLETAGDLVSDLHVWQIGPGHCAAIVSIVTDRPQTPAAYKARLADLDRLSHVTVEVSPCPHRHDHDSA